MEKKHQKPWIHAAGFLAAFVLWTAAVQHVDVQPIGPLNSPVGFASANRLFHSLTGVHWQLYTLTDWLGLVPLTFAAGFACLGLIQWIHRKEVLKVDDSLLVLGGFYLTVMAAYFLFETFPVNYRPVLVNGRLEASYPSSTTLLVLCIMPTAVRQLKERNIPGKRIVLPLIRIFTVLMVVGRLLSGVHWLTDIIGSLLLSAGLVKLYQSFIISFSKKN